MTDNNSLEMSSEPIKKCHTGISGFDEITFGGLPQGRPTLITGGAGSGKTMFAMEFIVNGATDYNEPGVYISFEEGTTDLEKNFASVGFDLKQLIADGRIIIEHIPLNRADYQETGEFDLDGLFIRLNAHVQKIGAKRIALDTIEVLFSTFSEHTIIRSELQRLFGWFKDKGLTAVITGEKGDGTLTRYGLEEYVADCVIFLDNRIENQIATRRLRIIKYRGSMHGLDEYPYLIDADGVSVLPTSSTGLLAPASSHRISTGIPRLDSMFSAKGYYRGSAILVSGEAGTGKTTVAAAFAAATVARGERCVYFAFEEAEAQIIRNMASVNIDLQSAVDSGLLTFYCTRSTECGLEMHLATMHKLIRKLNPAVVIVDPVSNLISAGNKLQVRAMLTRLIDFLKLQEITSLYTDLTTGERIAESTSTGISSLMDTWLWSGFVEGNGERNRLFSILKSRGMSHSNQMREVVLSDDGVDLIDVYVSGDKVLTGAARISQQVKEEQERFRIHKERELKTQVANEKEKNIEAQIAALNAELLLTKTRYSLDSRETKERNGIVADARTAMGKHRSIDTE